MKQWFWIVRLNGRVVAALVEAGHTAEQLVEALTEFSEASPVERVFLKSVTLGEPLP